MKSTFREARHHGDQTLKNPTPISTYLGITPYRSRSRLERESLFRLSHLYPERDLDKPIRLHVLSSPAASWWRLETSPYHFFWTSYSASSCPLFSTPIALGGIGLPPPVTGYILATFGIVNRVVRIVLFSKDTWCVGIQKVISLGYRIHPFHRSCFPGLNWLRT